MKKLLQSLFSLVLLLIIIVPSITNAQIRSYGVGAQNTGGYALGKGSLIESRLQNAIAKFKINVIKLKSSRVMKVITK